MIEFISTKEAAKILKISQQRVIQLINKGRFKSANKVGNSWILLKSEVDDFKLNKPGRPKG